MAYTRRNTAEDIRANRVWTADAPADLASIPAKHGDMAFEATNNHAYVYVDGVGWCNISQIDLATQVTGTLDEANGGTGLTSYTAGDLIYASGATTLAKLAKGASANMVLQQGASAPFWSDTISADVLSSNSFSTGAITMSGLLTTTNGQISFPAVQNASTGANVLDDYEEGTWTPSLNFGGGTTGITYNKQLGRYQKIGNTVYVTIEMELTSKGSSTGIAQITGLPFTSVNGRPLGTLTTPYAVNMAGLTSPVSGLVLINATSLYLYDTGATGIANLDDTNFNNTAYLVLFGFYTAAN